MKSLILATLVCVSLIAAGNAEARKSYSSSGYGTGSKSSSTRVSGYTKKTGTYVAPARRSTPDRTTQNNWSTKPNTNPYTGKQGTRTTPPMGR
jgi:hypothetical protein